MRKFWVIVKREYITRVRKRSFIVMTILGPTLLAGIIILSAYLSMRETENHYVLVVDSKMPFFKRISNMGNCKGEIPVPFMRGALPSIIGANIPILCYKYAGNIDLDTGKMKLLEGAYTALLYIPDNIERSNTALLFFRKQPSLYTLRTIEKHLEKILEEEKLKSLNVDLSSFYSARTEVKVKLKKLETGEEKTLFSEISVVGVFLSVLIYIFIFMYSAQVMRGVLEEKTGRIVEILITSVRPFTLMMGKIIGIAGVGLTQFIIWVILVFVIVGVAWFFLIFSKLDPSLIAATTQMTPDLAREVLGQSQINLYDFYRNWVGFRLNIPLIIFFFMFYFLFGYLMYASLFAAVGAIVDSESDVQQFIFPLTLPLLFSYLLMPAILSNPDSSLSMWLSLIPLTSPVASMVRIPFFMDENGNWHGNWEFYLSMILLVLGFLVATYVAGRLYRIGILKYGAKPTYKQVLLWLFTKA